MQLGGMVFLIYFLPVFLLLDYCVPEKRRKLLLMAANIVFYALAGWRLLEFLVVVSLGTFIAGKEIEKHSEQKLYYEIPVIAGVSAFFWKGHMAGFGRMPVAAFFILESIRYLGEVYRKKRKAEENFGEFFLFMSYFPVSQGGPVRGYKRIEFLESGVSAVEKRKGIKCFIEGLAMQAILGSVMQDTVRRILYDGVFRGAHLDLAFVWMGAFAGGFYIYFTFYGACRMASGLSLVMGISIEKNFDYPLLSTGIQNFTERFNSSVTGLIWENLIEPLKEAGSDKTRLLTYGAAFLLAGNLFGFRIMCFLWGAYMFLLWYLETRILKHFTQRLPKALGGICTAALVAAGWIVLLSPDIGTALIYTGQMVGIGTKGLWSPECVFLLVNRWYIWLFAFLAATPALTFLKNRQHFIKEDGVAEAIIYSLLLLLAISYMFAGSGMQDLAGLM